MSQPRPLVSPRARRATETATVALRAQSDLPDLPPMYSGGLLACYGPLIYLAMRLRAGERPQVASRMLRVQTGERLVEARERAMDLGLSKEDVQDAELAVIALLDSAAQAHPGELRELWAGRTLENERYQSTTAGHSFFENLQRLLKRGEPDVLEIYRLALVAGFEGEKRDRPQDIKPLMLEIQRQLLARRGPDQLSPRASVELPPPLPEAHHASPWAVLAASAAFVMLLWVGCVGLILAQAQDIGQSALTLSQMLGSP